MDEHSEPVGLSGSPAPPQPQEDAHHSPDYASLLAEMEQIKRLRAEEAARREAERKKYQEMLQFMDPVTRRKVQTGWPPTRATPASIPPSAAPSGASTSTLPTALPSTSPNPLGVTSAQGPTHALQGAPFVAAPPAPQGPTSTPSERRESLPPSPLLQSGPAPGPTALGRAPRTRAVRTFEGSALIRSRSASPVPAAAPLVQAPATVLAPREPGLSSDMDASSAGPGLSDLHSSRESLGSSGVSVSAIPHLSDVLPPPSERREEPDEPLTVVYGAELREERSEPLNVTNGERVLLGLANGEQDPQEVVAGGRGGHPRPTKRPASSLSGPDSAPGPGVPSLLESQDVGRPPSADPAAGVAPQRPASATRQLEALSRQVDDPPPEGLWGNNPVPVPSPSPNPLAPLPEPTAHRRSGSLEPLLQPPGAPASSDGQPGAGTAPALAPADRPARPMSAKDAFFRSARPPPTGVAQRTPQRLLRPQSARPNSSPNPQLALQALLPAHFRHSTGAPIAAPPDPFLWFLDTNARSRPSSARSARPGSAATPRQATTTSADGACLPCLPSLSSGRPSSAGLRGTQAPAPSGSYTQVTVQSVCVDGLPGQASNSAAGPYAVLTVGAQCHICERRAAAPNVGNQGPGVRWDTSLTFQVEDVRHEWLLVEVYQSLVVDAAQPLTAGGPPKSRLLGSADILFAELLAPPCSGPWSRPLVLDTPNSSVGENPPPTLSITAVANMTAGPTAPARPIPSLDPTPPLGTSFTGAGSWEREGTGTAGVQSPYQRHFLAVQKLVTDEYTGRDDLALEQEKAWQVLIVPIAEALARINERHRIDLELTFHRAENLPLGPRHGSVLLPVAVAHLGTEVFMTNAAFNTCSPEWEESTTLRVGSLTDTLRVAVYNGDDAEACMGRASVPLHRLQDGKQHLMLPLKPSKPVDTDPVLHMSCQLIKAGASMVQQPDTGLNSKAVSDHLMK